MATSDRFDTFLNNIKLTTTQRDDAKVKYDGVCKKLHDYFYSTTYDGSSKLLVGSYGKGTSIRPARDIDVYFKLPWSEFNQSSSAYNVQSALLQRIKKILLDKYSDTEIKADKHVVAVNFSNAHFVEVVPCFEATIGERSGQFWIPNTSGGGSWLISDPRAELKNISNSDTAHGGNTRNLIKMIKKWQDNCLVPIKSIVIELRAVNFLTSYKYANNSSVYYDWMVKDYFEALLKFVNGECTMPGLHEKIYYGSEWKSKAESAYARSVKACNYESQNEYNATLEWKKIFGEDFYF
ncbi:MAG: nucleotidyltransferase [Ignavibacteria bacterium]